MRNEIVLPNELSEVLDNSSITDLTKAQAIAINYAPMMESVTIQMNLLQKLQKGKKEDVEQAKRIRLDLGKICSLAEKQKKDDKNVLLLETRFIDALFNTVNGAARLTQTEAKEIEQHFEMLEEQRLQKLQEKRVKELSEFVEDAHERDLSGMEPDVWEAYFSTKKQAHIDLIAAEKQAEEDRVAKENAEKVEQERIRKENEQLKNDAERKARQVEQERLEREAQLKIEQSAKKLRDDAGIARQEILKDINVHLDFPTCANMNDAQWNDFFETKNKEFQAEQNRLFIENKKREAERLDREKIEKELEDKKTAELKADNEEKERIQSELKKGDSAKVKDLLRDLKELKSKYTFKAAKNKKIYNDVSQLIDKIIFHINPY